MSAALPSPRAAAALVAAGFRRWASYRAATLAGAFTNTFFGVVRLAILFAAADAAGGAVAGYDRAALSTYTWVAQGMIAVVVLFGSFELAQRVRTGDVAVDLGRPVHPVAGVAGRGRRPGRPGLPGPVLRAAGDRLAALRPAGAASTS